MGEKKPTNPKDSLGVKKVPLHCVPSAPLFELGLAMMEGGRKYGSHNYRDVGVRMSVYYDAVMRHLIAWWEGENIDPDSGVHHVIKAIACLFVLRDSMIMDNCEDDRPIKYTNGLDMNKLNKQAEALIKKYPQSAKPFLEKDKHKKCNINTKCCNNCTKRKMMDKEKFKIYVSHSIRGPKGCNASDADMKKNCERIIKVVEKLRKLHPEIDFYVPAEHEDFVQKAYKKKYITEDQILKIDCEIIDECDMVAIFTPSDDPIVQGGRLVEKSHAFTTGKPVYQFRDFAELDNYLTKL